MKKQIEVKIKVVSDTPIFSYHLLEVAKRINCSNLYIKTDSLTEPKIISSRVTVDGLFFILEYDSEDYTIRRIIQSYNEIRYNYETRNIYYIYDDKVKITNPLFWFKTINDSGMLSEYYVVEYENRKYLFLDHICAYREIFDIENDVVYKDFLNRRIPCDFKTDIYKKYLKDKDMTNSEWTVKEFKRNKMNYNFTTRMY
jgi:hypothetical protein